MARQTATVTDDLHGPGVPNRAEVIEALRRVLTSATFRSSTRAREFLSFVVREALEGRGETLNERRIARLALGRDRQFDARLDPTVRVQANRLRERLDRYYLDEGRDDPIRISIPVGRYTPAWTLRTAIESHEPRSGPSLTRGPAVAVFRLRAGTAEGRDHRLAVALSESLVHAFTTFPGLRVVGPLQQSDRLANRTDLLDVGQRTQSAFCLAGSVVEIDGQLRVTIQLANTTTGEVVWSEQIDRAADAVTAFSATDDVVARVVGRVGDFHGIVLRRREAGGHPTDDPTVYDAITKHYELLDSLDPSLFAGTIEALNLAVAREPSNPFVLGALARVHAVDVLMRGPLEASASLRLARMHAHAAKRIDRNLPESEAALAIVALANDERDLCRSHVLRLRELAPHHPSFLYLSGLLTAGCGDWDEGILLIRRSMELNPLHPRHYGTLVAVDLLRRGDVAGALNEANLLVFPGYVWGPLLSAICLDLLGMTEEAREATAALLAVAPDFFDRPRVWVGSAPAITSEIADLLVSRASALARFR